MKDEQAPLVKNVGCHIQIRSNLSMEILGLAMEAHFFLHGK